MSERWKHQIVSGLTWAVVTLLILVVFDYKNNTLEKNCFPICGIFFNRNFCFWLLELEK